MMARSSRRLRRLVVLLLLLLGVVFVAVMWASERGERENGDIIKRRTLVLHFVARHAKTDGYVAIIARERVATGRPAIGRTCAKAASPSNPVLRRSAFANGIVLFLFGPRVVSKAVVAPFHQVAVHVKQAEGVGGKVPHRSRP